MILCTEDFKTNFIAIYLIALNMKYQQYAFHFYHFCFSKYFFSKCYLLRALIKKKLDTGKGGWISIVTSVILLKMSFDAIRVSLGDNDWCLLQAHPCCKACIKNLLVDMKILKQSIYHFSFIHSKFKDILRKKFFIELLLIKNELFFLRD